MIFTRTIKNINRLREIARILLKYGFEDVIAYTPLKAVIPNRARLGWKKAEEFEKYSHWELLRMATEELGPSFIKFGQLLANRPDLLPAGLIRELQRLQSDVPPFPFEQVEEIINRSLKAPWNTIFSSIEPVPIGAASIGQVHRAELMNGRQVVIKIRRPGVKSKVETDLYIVKDIVRRSEKFFQSQGILNAMDIVNSFERSIMRELDYTFEARHMAQFRHYYRKRKDFYIPLVYKEYSTEEVLTMERVSGCKITDARQLNIWGINTEKLAEQGMDIYMSQIFEHGFFHADPHPGNIIISEKGVINLIDFGMVGKLNKQEKFAFAGIFMGMAQKDPRKMARNFRRLSPDTFIEDRAAFEREMSDIIDDFAYQSVEEASIADLAVRMQEVIRVYGLRVPGDIFIILRALTILEGIGKTIHPHFQTFEFIRPYGFRILREQYAPGYVADQVYSTSMQFLSFLNTFPVDVKAILRKLSRGRLHIRIEHLGYEAGVEKITNSVNRFSLVMLIVSLITGSAIFALAPFSDSLTTAGGMPYISIAGLVLAGLLSFVWVVMVWWQGRS